MENLVLGNVIDNELSVGWGLINIFVSLVLSLLLKLHFEKFSSTLSGKKEIARLLPFLAMIVCLIINIVKSSLALSLGLVGALSIVRFRTPVKEPEDLVYIFMSIAIGVGLGANQTVVTVLSTLTILGLLSLVRWKFKADSTKSLYLNITWNNAEKYDAKDITAAMSAHVDYSDLKRYDVDGEAINLSYSIGIVDGNGAFKLLESLRKTFPSAHISFIDQSRIPGI